MSFMDGPKGIDVVIANPPASSGDDGFGFRRRILREAPAVLRPGGLLVMQWLSYYTSPGAEVNVKIHFHAW